MPGRTTSIKVTGNVTEAIAALDHLGVRAEMVAKETEGHFDKATKGVGGAFQKLGGLAGGFGLPFSESLAKIGDRLDETETKGKKLGAALAEVGKVALTAGVAGAAAIGAEGVKLAENYQQATAKISASANISEAAANKIGAAFLATGFKSTFSAQEMADAYGQVAGQLSATEGHALGTAQAVQVMSAATDLAEASGSSLNDTTAALAATMQAYGLKTKDAAKAGDVLYNVSRITNQPVLGLAQVLDRLKGRLGQLAPSLEDVGTLMSFPAVAAQGSRGAMVVNTALTTLLGGSKTVNAELKKLNVSLYDQHGKFVGLRSIIEQLQPRLDRMSQAQQIAAEKTIFGSSAAQLMAQVIQGGVPAYDQAKARVDALGSAQSAAEKQSSTFHGQTEKLKAGLEDLGVKVGQWLIPKLDDLAAMSEKVVGWFDKHKTAAKALALVFTGVLGAAVTSFAVTKIAGLVSSISHGIGALRSMGSALSTLATRFLGVGSAATTMATETEAANASAAASTATTDTTIEGENVAAGASYAERGAGAEAGAVGGVGGGAGAGAGAGGVLGGVAVGALGEAYAWRSAQSAAKQYHSELLGMVNFASNFVVPGLGVLANKIGMASSGYHQIKYDTDQLRTALVNVQQPMSDTITQWVAAQAQQQGLDQILAKAGITVDQYAQAVSGGRIAYENLQQQWLSGGQVSMQQSGMLGDLARSAWKTAGGYDAIRASQDKVKPVVTSKILIDVSQAEAAFQDLTNSFSNLQNGVNAKIFGASASGRFGTVARASGGFVYGAGTATSDSINARLSNGEYVLSDAMLSGSQPVDPHVAAAVSRNAGMHGGGNARGGVGTVNIAVTAATNASPHAIAGDINFMLRPYLQGG